MFSLRLAYIEGGSKANAIPRNGKAIIVLDKEDEDKALKAIEGVEELIYNELKANEPDFKLKVEKLEDNINKVLSEDTYSRLISILTLIPTGVQSMSKEMEGLVESSCNLAVVKIAGDKIIVESSIRSSKEILKENLSKQIKTVADIVKAEMESYGSYPAWEFKENSNIREIFKKVYKDLYGEDLRVATIHAGLECGIFAEKFPHMDMISFGPNMYGAHTPEEKLSISSTERTYNLLLNVLKEIK